MDIVITRSIVKEIYSDDLEREIKAYLNSVIDEEFEKDDGDVDTDLVDECINAIDSLENSDTSPALKILLREKDILKYCKRKARPKSSAQKRAIAACLILVVCSGAAILNTDTAFAKQVKEVFSQIMEALNTAAGKSENGESRISSVYAVFPPDYSFRVKSRSDIDFGSITVYAVYKDGSESIVPLSECTVDITEESEKLLVAIAYKGCAFSIIYTLER